MRPRLTAIITAGTMATPDVAFLNLSQGLAILTDGRVCEITTLIDSDGDITDAPASAVVCVAQTPSGNWLTIDLDAFEPMETQ